MNESTGAIVPPPHIKEVEKMYYTVFNGQQSSYSTNLDDARKNALGLAKDTEWDQIKIYSTNNQWSNYLGTIINQCFGTASEYTYTSKGIAYPMDKDGHITEDYSWKMDSSIESWINLLLAKCFVQVHTIEMAIPFMYEDNARLYVIQVLKAHPEINSMDFTADKDGMKHIGSIIRLKSISDSAKTEFVFVGSDGLVYEIRRNGSLKKMSVKQVQAEFGKALKKLTE